MATTSREIPSTTKARRIGVLSGDRAEVGLIWMLRAAGVGLVGVSVVGSFYGLRGLACSPPVTILFRYAGATLVVSCGVRGPGGIESGAVGRTAPCRTGCPMVGIVCRSVAYLGGDELGCVRSSPVGVGLAPYPCCPDGHWR